MFYSNQVEIRKNNHEDAQHCKRLHLTA